MYNIIIEMLNKIRRLDEGFKWQDSNILPRVANLVLRNYFGIAGELVGDRIGCGFFGCIYETTLMKDIVVKVTKDKREAILVQNKLLNKNFDYIIKYYYVAKVNLGINNQER